MSLYLTTNGLSVNKDDLCNYVCQKTYEAIERIVNAYINGRKEKDGNVCGHAFVELMGEVDHHTLTATLDHLQEKYDGVDHLGTVKALTDTIFDNALPLEARTYLDTTRVSLNTYKEIFEVFEIGYSEDDELQVKVPPYLWMSKALSGIATINGSDDGRYILTYQDKEVEDSAHLQQLFWGLNYPTTLLETINDLCEEFDYDSDDAFRVLREECQLFLGENKPPLLSEGETLEKLDREQLIDSVEGKHTLYKETAMLSITPRVNLRVELSTIVRYTIDYKLGRQWRKGDRQTAASALRKLIDLLQSGYTDLNDGWYTRVDKKVVESHLEEGGHIAEIKSPLTWTHNNIDKYYINEDKQLFVLLGEYDDIIHCDEESYEERLRVACNDFDLSDWLE